MTGHHESGMFLLPKLGPGQKKVREKIVVKRKIFLPVVLASVALIGASNFATAATNATVAKPFPALAAPNLTKSLTLAQAKAFVAVASGLTTKWTGPTKGPLAQKGDYTIAYVSSDQSYVSYVNWGDGVKAAANALGWKSVNFDGKGTVSGNLDAMNQAVASNPIAIVTSADASALQVPIQEAVSKGIPVIGIHATAFPGPHPELGLFDEISSDPAQIGLAQAAYVIAASGGKARQVHMLDNSYAIARFKGQAASLPTKNLKTAKFLTEINIPVAEQNTRIPAAVTSMISKYGTKDLWVTTCCDNFYTDVAAALRSSGIKPNQVKLVGSDGPPSAYDMIRKGEFEVATVPEPSTLFGYQAVDAVVHAMAGIAPAVFSAPVHLVTKANVETEGGKSNQYIPSNGFACQYTNIWLGTKTACQVG